MIVELVMALGVVWGGGLTMRLLGLRSLVLAITAPLAGVMGYLAIMMVQVVTPLPTTPVLTLAVLVTVPSIWWAVARARGQDVALAGTAVLVTVAGVALLTAVVRALGLMNWHGDSVFYALEGTTLVSGRFYDAAFMEYFLKRPLGVPALHAPAALQGEQVLLGITPLIAVAGLAWVGWCIHRGAKTVVTPRMAAVAATAAVAFLVTSNRVVFHAFYVNGHLLLGVMVAVAAGAAWLVSQRLFPLPAATALIAGAVVVAVVTRAEGALTMAIVLTPLLLWPGFTAPWRRFLARWFGAVVLVWNGWGWWLSGHTGEALAPSTVAQGVAGAAVLLGAGLIGRPWWDSHARALLILAEAALWVAVALVVVTDPQVLIDSATATATNQFKAGKWGVTMVVAGAAVAAVTVMVKTPAGSLLRFPVTTFIPMVILLAYVREGAYRVGAYDSLNRMWMQVLLVSVVYVGIALTCGARRERRTRGPARGSSRPRRRTARTARE